VSISTNDLKNGMALNLPEGLMTVIEFQHVKPGKGGAFVRTKLKNFRTGAVLERTFRADEKVPLAVIDKREMQYLYREGTAYVFMDNESYEQIHVETSDLGSAVNFMKEGDTVILPVYDGNVVGVELPAAVELTIAETEPGVQGDRVSDSATRPRPGARRPPRCSTSNRCRPTRTPWCWSAAWPRTGRRSTRS
jgi:elongation factor P